MTRYTNEYGEHMVRMTLSELGPVSEAELDALRVRRQQGVNLDDPDCPPMSESLHKQAQQIAAQRRESGKVAVAK